MSDTVLRYVEMLRSIPRAPRKVTVGELHEKLKVAGFTINKRSVERDIQTLSQKFRIYSDEEKPAGWSWAASAPELNAPGMSTSEALELELVAQYLKPLLPSNAFKALQPRLKAARASLEVMPHAPLAHWRHCVAVLEDGSPLQTPDVSEAVISVVHESLMHSRCFEVNYRSVGACRAKKFKVNPLALVYSGQVGYLVATINDYSDLRHLALHRMSQPVALEVHGWLPEGFNLTAYLREQSAFDFPGETVLKLKLQVSSWLARQLEERRLSSDQRITPTEDDDSFIVEASIRESERLVWWLRSQGGEVEVLEPRALRARFAKEAAALNARYRK